MTLLTICEGLAKNTGRQVPTQVASSTHRDEVEYLQFANETGEELARRVDWGDLTKTATLTGTGANIAHSLPSDFGRLTRGIAVKTSGGAIVRPLTRGEWNSLTAVEGTPRYFLLQDDTITLWPFLASAATATVYYQSSEWCSAGTSFAADSDTSLIDENLFLKAMIVRFRRQKGMDYADHEAEYEAALRDFAGFDERARF